MRPALEAEQEVDFGRYGRTIAARWWLVALAVGAGVVVGWAVSLGGGTVYRATATVYLGQPLSPSGNAQIQSLATNPATVSQIVRSPSVTRPIAGALGVKPGRLRSGISTKAVSGAVAKAGQTQLVEISVRGPWREESAEAANRLADTVVARVSGYVDSKISALGQLAGSQEHELDRLGRQLDENGAAIASGTGLEPVERLTLANLGVILEQRRGQLVEDLLQTRQLLTLARDVERAQLVTEAAAVEVAARSGRNSMLVGGVIGLIAGALLALLWEPLAGRRLQTRRP
jgi:uncharacterized protein involved in exopolysaccharide biosynthesis